MANILPCGGRGEAANILGDHKLVRTGGNMVHKLGDGNVKVVGGVVITA